MKYAIISDKGCHEFDIQVIESKDSKTYSLYRSNSDIWTEPGEHLQTITDYGNGIKLSEKIKKNLDYGAFAELTILLDFIKNYDSILMESYTIYKPM